MFSCSRGRALGTRLLIFMLLPPVGQVLNAHYPARLNRQKTTAKRSPAAERFAESTLTRAAVPYRLTPSIRWPVRGVKRFFGHGRPPGVL